MTEPTSTAVAAPAPTATLGAVEMLLEELRASPELNASAAGVRLQQRIENALVAVLDNPSLGKSQITDVVKMKAFMDFGTFVSKGSATLPAHLKGNAADCTAIAMRAERWGLDFYGVAEKTHIVQGKLGYEGQLVGAILKNMGAIKEAALHDEYFGPWEKILGKFKEIESKKKQDDHGNFVKYKVPAWRAEDEEGLGIRVWGTLPGETEPRSLEILMSQALTRNSTLWAGNPKQQIFYLAEKLWARKYAPGALLGVNTVDDLYEAAGVREMGMVDEVGGGQPQGQGQKQGLTPAEIAAWRDAATRGTEAVKKHWAAMGKDLRGRASDLQRNAMWDIATKADAERTVDNAAAPAAAPAPAAAAAPAEASKTAASAADPATGAIDDDFVRSMEAAEKSDKAQ
jgi:hypothetical protein